MSEIISLDIAKEYLRLDEDDKISQMSIDYAIEQWRNQVDDFDKKLKIDGFVKLIRIPILLTIQAAYDDREYIKVNKSSDKVNRIISSAHLQANYCYSVEEVMES